MTTLTGVVEALLQSNEASVRFRTRIDVLSEDLDSAKRSRLQEEIRRSPRVRGILSQRRKDGKILAHPYAKWYGAHWVLAALADLCYPASDESLVPLKEQVYEWLFSKEHLKLELHHHMFAAPIRRVRGLFRAHASMEANALYSTLKLGLADERTDGLAQRLIDLQWPDGGWNCDRKPNASNSSFTESLIPLRALALHAKVRRSSASRDAARRTAEIFLKRRLYKRQRDGRIMREDFVKLHYPCYWHYDILFGLKVMVEAGFISDRRCEDALDLIESKRLPDGGFPAEKRYYRVSNKTKIGSLTSLVDWGGMSKNHMNEFVTVDALQVLVASGRGFE